MEDAVASLAGGPAESLHKLLSSLVEGVPVAHVVIEVVLVLILIYVTLFSRRKKSSDHSGLSPEDEQMLLDEWEPDPLVKPADRDQQHDDAEQIVVQGVVGTRVKIGGSMKLNFGSFNFLGMVGREDTRAAAEAAAHKYGIGSCGPRGFYGTIDCHLKLEEELAKFMGVEEAILYSYGFSTIASVIPAYCKRGDIIFFDKGVTFAIQKGLVASRSRLVPFEHNDMDDLERLLKNQAREDKKDPQKANATRRFVVVEGLYECSGDIAPLDKLVELKYKYKVRIFLEESMSFGVLGRNGRGITEHFNIDATKIDCIAAAMGNAMGSIGGFACGSRYVIDHQRLSGAGYCYSASLPPLLAVACSKALEINIAAKGGLQSKLAKNAELMRSRAYEIDEVVVGGWRGSPVMHLRLANQRLSRDLQLEFLTKVVVAAREKDIALVIPHYVAEEEFYLPAPSIRVTVSAEHEPKDMEAAMDTLAAIIHELCPSPVQGLSF